jgi:hypothetical protein
VKWISNYQQIGEHSQFKTNLSEKILKLLYSIIIDSLALNASFSSQDDTDIDCDEHTSSKNWQETFTQAFKELRAFFSHTTTYISSVSANHSQVSIKIVDVTISNKENHHLN